MKTLNSNKNTLDRHIKIFTNAKTNKYCGFSGIVRVNNADIYVNTQTGSGYEAVINELNGMINFLSAKYQFNGCSFEDRRHNIIVHILEGMPKYDPRRGTKLSSFLQMRINRRLINELRNESRISKNATFLNINTFHILCECGANTHVNIPVGDSIEDNVCPECQMSLADVKQIVSSSAPELNASMVSIPMHSGNGYDDIETLDYAGSKTHNIFGQQIKLDEEVIYISDLQKWLQDEDPRVVKIIELVCFNDYSITDAAKQVGLTGAGASLKLKNLKKKKIVKELLGR